MRNPTMPCALSPTQTTSRAARHAHRPCQAFAALTLLSLSLGTQCIAQSTAQKPTLSREDYGKWENLGRRAVLTKDGRWLAFEVTHVNREFELRLRDLSADQPRVIPWGRTPIFSADGRWVAWSTDVSEEERERLTKAEKPVRNGMGMLELGTDAERKFDEIARFRFDETGRFLALLGYAPEEPKRRGADLQILDLAAGSEIALGNVTEFAWSEAGSLLALTIGTGADSGNGVQLYDAANGRLQGLDSSGATYRKLAWRKAADDLAALRTVKKASKKGTAHTLLAWKGLTKAKHEHFELASSLVDEEFEIVEHGGPTWSEDGKILAFGLRPVEPEDESEDESKDEEEKAESDEAEKDENSEGEKAEKEKEVDLPDLQIWHSSDVRIFPRQKSGSEADKKRTLLTVWHLGDMRIVRIGTDLDERCQLIGDWSFALEQVQAPYPWGRMFGRRYHDLYSIQVASGARTRVLERVRHTWASAGGRYVLWFDGEHYWTRDLGTGKQVNITGTLETGFANAQYDTPTDLMPPHGVAGWLKDDSAVLLHDRFDVWRVAPDGSGGTRLTRGAEGRVVHRLVDLDPKEREIDGTAPFYFSLRGEDSEKRGYARMLPNATATERLLFADKMISNLQKAEEQDLFLYRVEARDDSPDYFVGGPDLSESRRVSNTNPFQGDYAWTRSELIDFESEAGVDLQATLLYPANHDPSRRYPMIVYTYEILAPQIHRYKSPDERVYYNETVWTQQGYFVLQPDIVYRPREPGTCAIEAVRPAVAKIVDMGLVDANKVGLIGHSWGGYNATYLPTRIDIFAASVAGAPLTDFVSFMGQIHWRSGMPELSHWETGQARMEVPFWEDPEAHRRNSPIHGVPQLNTPILMAFGDKDGTVDWDQGTEFYNFVRRAQKRMVLLVYEGEGHGFKKKPNQIDYHRRILEWFGHYLKGEPAPKWISEGVPFADQEDERRRVAEDK